LAYAVRRLQGIFEAREVLLKAEKIHETEPTIKFNLGCYAAIEGKLEEAKIYVQKSIKLDKSFEDMAKHDPDLESLRKAGIL
jgi:Flp pilus assembly protein TadD